MKTWSSINKSNWERGEWDNEPDKAHWINEETGFDCLIVRGPHGALCGYVGVPPEHKYFKKEYGAVEDAENYIGIHGGLTFSGLCRDNSDESKGICHPESCAANKTVWWLGFDCAHCDDFSPGYDLLGISDSTYRSFDYVKREVESLAAQL